MPHRPMIDAIEQGDSARVRELLHENPQAAKARDEHGVSALLLALYHRAQEAVELILDAEPRIDVFEAAALGRLAELRALVREDDATLAQRSADGFSPLHLACFFGHEDAVDLLLDSGADANAVAENDSSVQPLHSAAASGNAAIVEMLLRNGASVNAQQNGGYVALHTSARNGEMEMTRLLLEYGGDPRAADVNGNTPIDLAREAGQSAMVDFLEDK